MSIWCTSLTFPSSRCIDSAQVQDGDAVEGGRSPDRSGSPLPHQSCSPSGRRSSTRQLFVRRPGDGVGDLRPGCAEPVAVAPRWARRARCVMVSVSIGGSVATVSDDGVIAVGDLSPRRPLGLRRYASVVGACAWSPSGEILAVVRPDGRVELLSPGLDLIAAFDVPASAVRSVAWTGGDHHLMVGGCDGSVHLLDRDGRQVGHLRSAQLWPVSMSAAAGLVAVGSLLGAPRMLHMTPD